MAERQADVKVRLRLDDQASKATDRVKQSFDRVTGSVGGAVRGIARFASQALAVTVGLSLGRLIEDFKSLGREAIQAASGAQQSQRQIGAMLMAASGAEFGKASSAARSVHNQLEDIGIASGVSADSVTAAFESMFGVVQKAGGGIEDSVRLTENLTRVAGPLGISMDQAGSSVLGIMSGLTRARDPMVQLLRNFGQLDVKSKSFAKLSEPQKLAALQSAFARVGETMRGVPPGFAQIVQSFKDVRDNIMEAFGTPIMNTIGKLLSRTSGWVQKHQMEVEIFAVRWGNKFAEFIQRSVELAARTFRWIQTHWDDIVAKAKQLPTLIGAGMAARMAAPAALGLAGRAVGAAGGMGRMLAGAGGTVARAASGVAAGAAPVATHFGQVIIGAGLRAAPAMQMAGGAATAAGPGLMGALGGPQAIATIGAAISAFMALVAIAAVAGGAMYAFKNNLSGMGTIFRTQMGTLWESLQKLWSSVRPLVELFAELAGRWVIALVFQLNGLVRAIKWIIDIIMREPIVQFAMRQFGISPESIRARDVQQERDEQATTRAEEISAWVQRQNEEAIARAQVEAAMGERPAQPVNDFRGSTFNLKMDFRDQDPDRVAVVFQRDINRAAEARITARTAIPFGA